MLNRFNTGFLKLRNVAYVGRDAARSKASKSGLDFMDGTVAADGLIGVIIVFGLGLPDNRAFICKGLPGEERLTIRLSIDRFEGDKKQIAVLLAEDGTAINFPKALLPKGAKAGDLLTLQIERDAEATRKLAEDTRKVQDQLKKTDPGET